jgi:hypothetical protein
MKMNNEKELLKKINHILSDFADYEKPIIIHNGDIIIKTKINIKKEKKDSILTNVFKEIIANDIKKNRV